MTLEKRLEATAKALKEHGTSVSDMLIADLLLEAQQRIGHYGDRMMTLQAELNEQNLQADNADGR